MDPIEAEDVLEEEVLRFVTDENGYYAFTTRRTLTITRATSVQLPIVDPESYATYLWVESLEGFYVLRQQISEQQPDAWFVVLAVQPRDRHGFYFEFLEALPEYLRAREGG